MTAIVSGDSLGLTLASYPASLAGTGTARTGQGAEQAFVNVASGNLVLQTRDGYVASAGADVDLVRT